MGLGIDISQWQTSGDFGAAAGAGLEFAVMKLGGSNTGTQYKGSQYDWQVDAARAAGVGVGHYWFNGGGDPATDANFFCDNLRGYTPSDMLVLDIETEAYPSWNAAQAMAFCQTVQSRMGVVPVLYMSSSLTRDDQWIPLRDMGARLWVASYGSNSGGQEGNPNTGIWPDWIIWQYTSNGSLPGWPGRLDMNTSRVSFRELSAETGESDMTPDQSNKLDALYAQIIVPNGGYSWSHANNNQGQVTMDALVKPSGPGLSGDFKPIDVLVTHAPATLSGVNKIIEQNTQLAAAVAALTAAQAGGAGVDPAVIQKAAEDGAKAALAATSFLVTPTGLVAPSSEPDITPKA